MTTAVSEKEQLLSLLVRGDEKLLDVKFFLSPTPKESGITEEDICRQINLARQQKQSGAATVSKSFCDTARKIDVRALFF